VIYFFQGGGGSWLPLW